MRGAHLYWLIWFILSFGSFLVREIWALCTNWRDTLSAAIWSLEDFRQGQPISGWSSSHLLFMGLFVLIFGWLVMHFGFGWWR